MGETLDSKLEQTSYVSILVLRIYLSEDPSSSSILQILVEMGEVNPKHLQHIDGKLLPLSL